MESTAEMQFTGRELRYLSDTYEQAQAARIEKGEQLRAVLQGRDESFVIRGDLVVPTVEQQEERGLEPLWIHEGETRTVPETLAAIGQGMTRGPVPFMGRSYHRHYQEERESRREMMQALEVHPAWDWLGRVRGIGPTLGCKLLARFDPSKAPHASSYWSYAGLGTVPAEKYRCDECGLVRAWPVGYDVTGNHKALGTGKKCSGSLVKVAAPDDGVRCAQPKAQRGEKSTYDRYAKKVCYLAATSFLKAGGPYEEFYRIERAKADRERPGWADGRKHYLALRKTQKLLLSHLWQVHRRELGLPTPDPWAVAHGGHDGKIEPEEMVE